MMEGSRISVPLRASNISGKKMRKRRELDALVASSNGLKRHGGGYNSGATACAKSSSGTTCHDQLLSESTDEQEDYWRATSRTPPKSNCKTSVSRRPTMPRPPNAFLNICLCLFAVVCLLVTSALACLFIDLRDQTRVLDRELRQVVAGNQGIPESLRKCHAETKELQRNQSDLYSRFTNLSLRVTNISTEVSSFLDELQKIQDRLKSTFDSSDLSGYAKDLLFNISSLYGGFEKLNSTVAQLKASEDSLKAEFSALRRNFTSLADNPSSIVPNKIDGLSSTDTNTSDMLGNFSLLASTLYSNMTYLNESLTAQMHSIKMNPFFNSNMEEKLNDLLNQNISIRLDAVESQFLQLSAAIDSNNSIANKYYGINNTSGVARPFRP